MGGGGVQCENAYLEGGGCFQMGQIKTKKIVSPMKAQNVTISNSLFLYILFSVLTYLGNY